MAAPQPLVKECTIDESGSEVRILQRVTRENRMLWYQLRVIQEPQHARACGAGTKANSDRRPVDPPPVVELRIREGPSFTDGKEITFDYNASFFLYASLEQSRKIAPGRIAAQPNPPILTGVPASGMAYLDRPIAAGYFIFPDLSVRHEGQYKLSFSLFETTKEEKDFDLMPPEGELPAGVDWRMEIKTRPFDVYSAKKFPGLLCSTPLSQAVADQGCRVRIRREVRMRKRESKSGGHRRDEERRRRTVTPATEDPQAIRARSASNASEHHTPYVVPERRPSDAYPPPPPVVPAEPVPRGHLSFGENQYSAHRPYAQPHLAPVSPSGPYAPAAQYGRPEAPPYIKPESAYSYASDRSVPPSPAAIKPEYERRPSTIIPASPSVYSNVEPSARRDSSHSSYPSTPSGPPQTHQTLPNIHRLAELSGKPTAPPFDFTHPANQHLAVDTSSKEESQRRSSPQVGGKRKHDVVFITNQQPLHNGERQGDRPCYTRGYANIYQESIDDNVGFYRSADGDQNFIPFNVFFD